MEGGSFHTDEASQKIEEDTTMGLDKKDTEKMAEDFMKFCNLLSMDDDYMNQFSDVVLGDHRTLQQNAMKIFLHCINRWASLEEGCYDLRNEATVKTCRKIVEAIGKDMLLPLI